MLNKYRPHFIVNLFGFSIFMSMSGYYLCLIDVIYFSVSFSFPLLINHIISLKCYFERFISFQSWFYFRFVSFQFSVRVLLSFCLIFCQFQPGVTYKSVAYKKACSFKNAFKAFDLIIFHEGLFKDESFIFKFKCNLSMDWKWFSA